MLKEKSFQVFFVLYILSSVNGQAQKTSTSWSTPTTTPSMIPGSTDQVGPLPKVKSETTLTKNISDPKTIYIVGHDTQIYNLINEISENEPDDNITVAFYVYKDKKHRLVKETRTSMKKLEQVLHKYNYYLCLGANYFENHPQNIHFISQVVTLPSIEKYCANGNENSSYANIYIGEDYELYSYGKGYDQDVSPLVIEPNTLKEFVEEFDGPLLILNFNFTSVDEELKFITPLTKYIIPCTNMNESKSDGRYSTNDEKPKEYKLNEELGKTVNQDSNLTNTDGNVPLYNSDTATSNGTYNISSQIANSQETSRMNNTFYNMTITPSNLETSSKYEDEGAIDITPTEASTNENVPLNIHLNPAIDSQHPALNSSSSAYIEDSKIIDTNITQNTESTSVAPNYVVAYTIPGNDYLVPHIRSDQENEHIEEYNVGDNQIKKQTNIYSSIDETTVYNVPVNAFDNGLAANVGQTQENVINIDLNDNHFIQQGIIIPNHMKPMQSRPKAQLISYSNVYNIVPHFHFIVPSDAKEQIGEKLQNVIQYPQICTCKSSQTVIGQSTKDPWVLKYLNHEYEIPNDIQNSELKTYNIKDVGESHSNEITGYNKYNMFEIYDIPYNNDIYKDIDIKTNNVNVKNPQISLHYPKEIQLEDWNKESEEENVPQDTTPYDYISQGTTNLGSDTPQSYTYSGNMAEMKEKETPELSYTQSETPNVPSSPDLYSGYKPQRPENQEITTSQIYSYTLPAYIPREVMNKKSKSQMIYPKNIAKTKGKKIYQPYYATDVTPDAVVPQTIEKSQQPYYLFITPNDQGTIKTIPKIGTILSPCNLQEIGNPIIPTPQFHINAPRDKLPQNIESTLIATLQSLNDPKNTPNTKAKDIYQQPSYMPFGKTNIQSTSKIETILSSVDITQQEGNQRNITNIPQEEEVNKKTYIFDLYPDPGSIRSTKAKITTQQPFYDIQSTPHKTDKTNLGSEYKPEEIIDRETNTPKAVTYPESIIDTRMMDTSQQPDILSVAPADQSTSHITPTIETVTSYNIPVEQSTQENIIMKYYTFPGSMKLKKERKKNPTKYHNLFPFIRTIQPFENTQEIENQDINKPQIYSGTAPVTVSQEVGNREITTPLFYPEVFYHKLPLNIENPLITRPQSYFINYGDSHKVQNQGTTTQISSNFAPGDSPQVFTIPPSYSNSPTETSQDAATIETTTSQSSYPGSSTQIKIENIIQHPYHSTFGVESFTNVTPTTETIPASNNVLQNIENQEYNTTPSYSSSPSGYISQDTTTITQHYTYPNNIQYTPKTYLENNASTTQSSVNVSQKAIDPKSYAQILKETSAQPYYTKVTPDYKTVTDNIPQMEMLPTVSPNLSTEGILRDGNKGITTAQFVYPDSTAHIKEKETEQPYSITTVFGNKSTRYSLPPANIPQEMRNQEITKPKIYLRLPEQVTNKKIPAPKPFVYPGITNTNPTGTYQQIYYTPSYTKKKEIQWPYFNRDITFGNNSTTNMIPKILYPANVPQETGNKTSNFKLFVIPYHQSTDIYPNIPHNVGNQEIYSNILQIYPNSAVENIPNTLSTFPSGLPQKQQISSKSPTSLNITSRTSAVEAPMTNSGLYQFTNEGKIKTVHDDIPRVIENGRVSPKLSFLTPELGSNSFYLKPVYVQSQSKKDGSIISYEPTSPLFHFKLNEDPQRHNKNDGSNIWQKTTTEPFPKATFGPISPEQMHATGYFIPAIGQQTKSNIDKYFENLATFKGHIPKSLVSFSLNNHYGSYMPKFGNINYLSLHNAQKGLNAGKLQQIHPFNITKVIPQNNFYLPSTPEKTNTYLNLNLPSAKMLYNNANKYYDYKGINYQSIDNVKHPEYLELPKQTGETIQPILESNIPPISNHFIPYKSYPKYVQPTKSIEVSFPYITNKPLGNINRDLNNLGIGANQFIPQYLNMDSQLSNLELVKKPVTNLNIPDVNQENILNEQLPILETIPDFQAIPSLKSPAYATFHKTHERKPKTTKIISNNIEPGDFQVKGVNIPVMTPKYLYETITIPDLISDSKLLKDIALRTSKTFNQPNINQSNIMKTPEEATQSKTRRILNEVLPDNESSKIISPYVQNILPPTQFVNVNKARGSNDIKFTKFQNLNMFHINPNVQNIDLSRLGTQLQQPSSSKFISQLYNRSPKQNQWTTPSSANALPQFSNIFPSQMQDFGKPVDGITNVKNIDLSQQWTQIQQPDSSPEQNQWTTPSSANVHPQFRNIFPSQMQDFDKPVDGIPNVQNIDLSRLWIQLQQPSSSKFISQLYNRLPKQNQWTTPSSANALPQFSNIFPSQMQDFGKPVVGIPYVQNIDLSQQWTQIQQPGSSKIISQLYNRSPEHNQWTTPSSANVLPQDFGGPVTGTSNTQNINPYGQWIGMNTFYPQIFDFKSQENIPKVQSPDLSQISKDISDSFPQISNIENINLPQRKQSSKSMLKFPTRIFQFDEPEYKVPITQSEIEPQLKYKPQILDFEKPTVKDPEIQDIKLSNKAFPAQIAGLSQRKVDQSSLRVIPKYITSEEMNNNFNILNKYPFQSTRSSFVFPTHLSNQKPNILEFSQMETDPNLLKYYRQQAFNLKKPASVKIPQNDVLQKGPESYDKYNDATKTQIIDLSNPNYDNKTPQFINLQKPNLSNYLKIRNNLPNIYLKNAEASEKQYLIPSPSSSVKTPVTDKFSSFYESIDRLEKEPVKQETIENIEPVRTTYPELSLRYVYGSKSPKPDVKGTTISTYIKPSDSKLYPSRTNLDFDVRTKKILKEGTGDLNIDQTPILDGNINKEFPSMISAEHPILETFISTPKEIGPKSTYVIPKMFYSTPETVEQTESSHLTDTSPYYTSKASQSSLIDKIYQPYPYINGAKNINLQAKSPMNIPSKPSSLLSYYQSIPQESPLLTLPSSKRVSFIDKLKSSLSKPCTLNQGSDLPFPAWYPSPPSAMVQHNPNINLIQENLSRDLKQYLISTKGEIFNNNNVITIPLNEAIIAKYISNAKEGNTFYLKTDNPDVNIKTWITKLKIVKAKLVLETREEEALNFMPVVNKDVKYDQKVVKKRVKEIISKLYGEPIVINGVYSYNPYVIYDFKESYLYNGRVNILWPSSYNCGCSAIGCEC